MVSDMACPGFPNGAGKSFAFRALAVLMLAGQCRTAPMGLFVATSDYGDGVSTEYGRTATAALQLICSHLNATTCKLRAPCSRGRVGGRAAGGFYFCTQSPQQPRLQPTESAHLFHFKTFFYLPARPPWSLIAPLRVRSLALDHLTDSAGTYASVPLAKLATYANPS